MTTLMANCQKLESKINSLERARGLAADLNHIQQRTGEWNSRYSKLTGLRIQTDFLTSSSQDGATVSTKDEALRQNARKVLSRLNENENVKELTRDTAWTRLLNSCEGLTEAIAVAGRNAWRSYLDTFGTLESPATLRLRTPPTPTNEEAIDAYERSYSKFILIERRDLPQSSDDLVQVTAHIASCRVAFAQIQFDLPDDVRFFYEAISTGKATLAHVTPNVATWLGEQSQLERFRVRIIAQ